MRRGIPIVDQNVAPNTWAGRPISYIRQVLTGFLQGVYQSLPEYPWDPDKNKSRIFIAGSSPIDSEAFGQYPCIAVSRSGMQFAGTGIGGVSHRDFRTGAVTRTDLINGMFIIQHISKREAEAEDLAFFTAEMCWAHQELLVRYGIIISGGIMVEQPAPAGSLIQGDTKGLIAVPVVLPYRTMRKVVTTPLGNPILAAVRFRISASLSEFPFPGEGEVESGLPRDGDPANLPEGPYQVNRPPSQEPAVAVSLARTTETKE